ncbi:hypothetical protein GCM10023350_06290 [Nocardioides endophyticus]|uniref:3-methyladenine DNA glycosylase n=1 Tax=Nocardioides endophyticus TaxID=1353775 RepID=A0ABP8YE27_9ACTN
MKVLPRAEWTARATAHEVRVDAFVAPHLARRSESVKHPVHDFLFTYYSQRPAQLRRWHPGYGVALAEAPEYESLKGYGVSTGSTTVDTSYVSSQRVLLTTLARLLRATASRPANFGCFGMHEWAMVYRLPEDETRHADRPLRLGPAGTDEVVESHRIACSHFDAYRFFTPSAAPLNTLSPTSADRAEFEQPACLHAGMDLYKASYRLLPMICSDLMADCFDLAVEIRELDMRASPYDLSGLGYSPVEIETPEGKKEYAAAQKDFAERGGLLRQQLIDECDRLLS